MDMNIALLIVVISSFLTPFMASSVNIALPSIGSEFGMDPILLSWLATAYSLASAMFLVPFGRIADILGLKRIFAYGVLVYTISSFLCAISPSASFLIAVRVCQGIGAAMIFGTSTAILLSIFPAGNRGRALGISTAAVYTGLSVGPFLGGFLTERLGWRSIFLINLPLGLVILTLVIWKLKGEWAEAKGERFDFTGSVIYSATLVALMYGFSKLPAAQGALLVAAGVLGFAAFVGWETRVENPVLDIHLFQNDLAFAFSSLAALINYSATSAAGFLLSLYLQNVKGLGPQDAGLVLIAQPIVQASFSPFAGRLSDRVEPRLVASIGMALTVVGLFLFAFLGANTSVVSIVAGLMLLGFGFALFSSPNVNAAMSGIEKARYGIASSTLATMRLLGQTFSMSLTMLVFATLIGRVRITPEIYPLFLKSLRLLFMIFAALCFGGIFASLARGKMRREDTRAKGS